MLRIGGADGLLMSLAGEIAEADINPVIVAESGAVAADARFILSAGAAAGQDASGADADRDAPGARTSQETFRPLFEPKTVAVLGASTKDVSIANTFIRRLKDFGYAGVIYPIHPKADEVRSEEPRLNSSH